MPEARRLSRLPLRVRLVAGFSTAMLIVLLGAGAFVYWRVAYALDRQLNQDLAEIAGRLTPLITGNGALAPSAPPSDRNQPFQVYDSSGRLLGYSPAIGPEPLLEPRALRSALAAPVRRDLGPLLPTTVRPLRVYAVPLPGGTQRAAAVLVVAVRRDHRDEALLELLAQLAVAGAGALVVTSVVGNRLATMALQPVERYRAQAAHIIDGASGVRLDVPTNRDDEVTRLGRTLNAMLDALEGALDRERGFIDDASHELRTPLTLLKTRVQLLAARPRTAAEYQLALTEIETDIDRLSRLSDELLRLGAAPPDNVGTVDLNLLAEHEILGRRELQAGVSHGPPLIHFQASRPCWVRLGAIEASQVITNILDNALTHGRPPVRVIVESSEGVTRLTVVDEGPGMGPPMLATATRRFARAPESRSRAGYGLGLSLVAGIVTRSGGELRLCYAGQHVSEGAVLPLPCSHDDRMTVSVLLPRPTALLMPPQPSHSRR